MLVCLCSFEWPIAFTEAQSASLDILVKNDVGLFSKGRKKMGKVVIRFFDLGDISQPSTAWYDGCCSFIDINFYFQQISSLFNAVSYVFIILAVST